jgi:hypothetical protein
VQSLASTAILGNNQQAAAFQKTPWEVKSLSSYVGQEQALDEEH